MGLTSLGATTVVCLAAIAAVCLMLLGRLCRHALRHGADIELGFKGPSIALWVRLRPDSRVAAGDPQSPAAGTSRDAPGAAAASVSDERTDCSLSR